VNQKAVRTDRQEITTDIQILNNLTKNALLHQSTINYHHLGNDLDNCLHLNTDEQSLGINSELYCYTEIKRQNKTPTPKPKRDCLCSGN